MLGPVQRLRICGSMCPCFVSEQEHAMRIADLFLQSVPILWYRKIKVSPYNEGGSTLLGATDDLFSGVCGKLEDHQIPKPARKPGMGPTITTFVPIEATLNVVDTNKGPALLITSNKYSFVDDDDETDTNKSEIMSKRILFKNMLLATAGKASEWEAIGVPPDDAFVILSKDMSADSNDKLARSKFTRVLTCRLLPGSKLSLSREETLRHLNTLISWDNTGPINEMTLEEVDTEEDVESTSEAIIVTPGCALIETSKQQSDTRDLQVIEVN